MNRPIVYELELTATPEHAFTVWTQKCDLWWPRSHCMSQSEGFAVVFEPFVGGRVYETGADGVEYEWGEVTVWAPPHRLSYLWHIFLERNRATLVEVTFASSEKGTQVRLVNSGFEVFGDGAEERAVRVGTAWESIIAEYRRAL